jgi:undecaprenyl-phosphate 4-deoxy-4-formamido-L-arabinose transferase
MPTVSLVIPVFNAEATISELCASIITEISNDVSEFEIILVDDCSGDNSWRIIESLASKDDRILGIELGRNFGQHNALLCGIRVAKYEVVVTLDDDLQHPASQIKKLLDKLAAGHDVVYGVPLVEQHGFLRNFASRVTKIALRGVIGFEAARDVSAFRIFHTNLREGFSDFRSPFVSIDVLLSWSTSKFSSVKVEHQPRAVGESNYTLRKLISHAFNIVTGYSALPLKLASVLGFALTFFGLLILGYVLIVYFLYDSSVPGFVFLASMISIFSGTQLFVMGIFGEYLARIHFRTLNRPQYFVREGTEPDGEIQIRSGHTISKP